MKHVKSIKALNTFNRFKTISRILRKLETFRIRKPCRHPISDISSRLKSNLKYATKIEIIIKELSSSARVQYKSLGVNLINVS